MAGTKFKKMHGLGNDFIIFDVRGGAALPDKDVLSGLTERRTGIGCDQIIVLDKPKDAEADIFMKILNAPDISEAQACGNATRCVASLLMNELDKDQVTIQTVAGLLPCEAVEGNRNRICADMGEAKLEWNEIPLAEKCDTLHLGIGVEEAHDPVAVNIGNPHAVFFIDNVEMAPVREWGTRIEHDRMFPERTNVEFAQIIDRKTIRMRVWERSAGETAACGSAACATIVAAVRRDLADRKADVLLNGGTLNLEWRESDGHVLMTGPVAYIFDGELAA